MGYCYGGKSRIISIALVPPPFFWLNAKRLPLHENAYFATTEESYWEVFVHGFKILGSLVFEARNDWTVERDVYPKF